MVFSSEILGNHHRQQIFLAAHVDYVVAKVKAATKALYPLLCGKSKLSLRNKRQLYLSYIQPIMTYASAAWTYDSTAIASALQVRQNKLLRVLTKAPWFVRNDALHRDLQLDPLNIVFQHHAVVLYDRLTRHTNPLLVSELIYEPWDGARYQPPT
jgi:hypothetical protein